VCLPATGWGYRPSLVAQLNGHYHERAASRIHFKAAALPLRRRHCSYLHQRHYHPRTGRLMPGPKPYIKQPKDKQKRQWRTRGK